jgi:hypothetical protein
MYLTTSLLHFVSSSSEKVKELETLKSQIEEKDQLILVTSAKLQETEQNLALVVEEVDLLKTKLKEKEALLTSQMDQLQTLEQEVFRFVKIM